MQGGRLPAAVWYRLLRGEVAFEHAEHAPPRLPGGWRLLQDQIPITWTNDELPSSTTRTTTLSETHVEDSWKGEVEGLYYLLGPHALSSTS